VIEAPTARVYMLSKWHTKYTHREICDAITALNAAETAYNTVVEIASDFFKDIDSLHVGLYPHLTTLHELLDSKDVPVPSFGFQNEYYPVKKWEKQTNWLMKRAQKIAQECLKLYEANHDKQTR
jgi:hypothetical protein